MGAHPLSEVDYAGAFKALMEQGRVEAPVIEEFIALWHSRSPNDSRKPCPLCYAAGGWGDLGPPDQQDAAFQMKCRLCKSSILLAGTQAPSEKPVAQRPSGKPARQRPSGKPARQRPSGKPARQRPGGTPASAPDAKESTVRWEFVFSTGPGAGPGSWTWRLLRIDGSIEQTSRPQPKFGKAVREAMTAGFSPKLDLWVIKRQNWITTFNRGTIISTGSSDPAIPAAP